ncbi:hypothetical protein TSUD_188320 [Trifolium subterraneum]|uniref:Reverse transcriptase Ty1/copia-type domain-containing protein n=1 Tax=Trifolium subterraneum TaxID=3900 RepID=A0A2Z6PR65_TRISU|nr:hypothetical protein TSUD_188320 [Trifolium subterraneum]
MKVIFGFQEVQEVIETGITLIAANATEAEQTAHRALKKKDFKTMFFIHQCVDLVNFQKIENGWDILEKGHSGNDKLKQVRLTTWKRQFELLQMDENESIAEYFNKITNITNQMKSCGSTVSDGDMVEKVIRTLSSKFDYITVAIMEAKDVSTMNLHSLESHEQRINARANNRTTDQALWAHTSKKGNGNKSKGKDQFKKENSQQESSKKNGNQGESSKFDGNGKGKKFMNKKNIQCYYFQKYGHFASECRNKKVPRQYNNKESEANMAQDDSGSETDALLMMMMVMMRKDKGKIEPEVTHVEEHVEAHVEEHVEAHVRSQVSSMEESNGGGNSVMERNNTRELVSLPTGKKLIAVKWVYKVKHKPDDTIAKYKARQVAKGFLQKPGIDFNEIFAPVARLETVRLVVAIANYFEWDCVQLDVMSAFLNGKLEEEVYVEQPQGFIVEGKEDHAKVEQNTIWYKTSTKLSYCKTEEHMVDVLKKPLKIEKFKDMRKMLNVFN